MMRRVSGVKRMGVAHHVWYMCALYVLCLWHGVRLRCAGVRACVL